MSDCTAEVGREKEPTRELFCLAFFSCSEMTVSRKTECISTKMGRVEYRNTITSVSQKGHESMIHGKSYSGYGER